MEKKKSNKGLIITIVILIILLLGLAGYICYDKFLTSDEKNNALYAKYKALADQEENVIFGGRLGMYKYFDMQNIVREALDLVKEEL